MELLTVLMRWNLRIEVSIYFNIKLKTLHLFRLLAEATTSGWKRPGRVN